MKNNTLKIMNWNANSIKNKLDELKYFIQVNDYDIIGINESKLDNKFKFNIQGYKLYRSDRNSKGGGVAIIIKKNLKHYLKPIKFNNFESISLSVETKLGDILVISIYIPPLQKISKDDLRKISNFKAKTLIMGDFNARHTAWNCLTCNVKGKELLQFCLTSNITIAAPEEATHFPKRGAPSIIDLFLLKNLKNYTQPVSICGLSSDHNPISIEISENALLENNVHRYNLNKANWKKFQHLVNINLDLKMQIKDKTDIDLHVEKLTKTINDSMSKSTPLTVSKPQEVLPTELQILIKRKNAYRRRYQRTRECIYENAMNVLIKSINHKIYVWRNKVWSDKLASVKPGNKTLWKVVKKIKNKRRSIAPLLTNKGYVFKESDKVNALAENFEKIYKSNLNMGSIHNDRKIVRNVNVFLKNAVINKNEMKLTSPRELQEIVKQFSNNKAPGIDEITYQVLKKLPLKGFIYLTKIINSIMMIGYFPEKWKIAKTIAILKPNKNPTLPGSYRPISLLNHLSKVTEKIIDKRLNKVLTKKKIVISEQFGFRDKHSTEMQLARLVNHITMQYNNKKHTGALLIDIEKAFDTVWHSGLIYKLIQYNIPTYLIIMLNSYIKERKMFVFNNGELSRLKIITAGVPQGSVLGPKLFNLYINDIPRNDKVNLALFADDTAFYCSSYRIDTIAKRLQESLTKVLKFFTKWKVRINEDKTEAVIFTKRRPEITKNIVFNNIIVNWTKSTKYLGITLDSRLTFSKHVNNINNKCIGLLRNLYPLINKNSGMSKRNKLLIYCTVVRPVIAYACPVWSFTCQSNLYQLQILQNKFLRLIGKYPKYTYVQLMHDELNIETIKEYIVGLTDHFFKRNRQCTVTGFKIFQY